MKSADYWLGKLSNLSVDRASGDPAPHKPLLLLVVLELAQEGSSLFALGHGHDGPARKAAVQER